MLSGIAGNMTVNFHIPQHASNKVKKKNLKDF